MNVWDFADKNPWYTFFLGFWVLMVLALTAGTVSLLVKSLNVQFRGWPPAHLDAAGDFKKETEVKKEDSKEEPERKFDGTNGNGYQPTAGQNKPTNPPPNLR